MITLTILVLSTIVGLVDLVVGGLFYGSIFAIYKGVQKLNNKQLKKRK